MEKHPIAMAAPSTVQVETLEVDLADIETINNSYSSIFIYSCVLVVVLIKIFVIVLVVRVLICHVTQTFHDI